MSDTVSTRPARGPLKDQTLRILRDRDVPVGTVLDVGVCHGTPELMRVWPDRPHQLFEPVAEFADRIRHTYRNIDHELHGVAVGDTEGSAALKVASVLPDMEISHSSMVEGAGEGLRQVPRVTLDGFLEGRALAEPFLLKIDIDGHELKVLRGAARTLARCSIVIVECQKSELVQRIAAVQAAGFDLFDLSEPCYYDQVLWQCDAVLVRKGLLAEKFKSLSGKVEPGMYETFRG
ncbi:hypothetical protein LCGC14_1668440 [marine sediment metagenome]|uniref:Methyltransferase FkbM domain-containing protein n=1 Tax=marine sediment metagenome TaxID=412755 RepID=A0A0F9HS03_9ZZZZ